MSHAAERTAFSGTQRHLDEGAHAWTFLGEACDVLCPRCDRIGRVRYRDDEATSRRKAAFFCIGCNLLVRDVPLYRHGAALAPGIDWFGPTCAEGQRNCGYCGARGLAHHERFPAGKAPASREVRVRCPQCGHDSPLTLAILPAHDHALGCEPATGMRLARSEPVAQGRTVWAYNAAHQAELVRFVAARLREGTMVANGSLVSRLPAWLKSARHRNKVLAAFERIERRMPSTQE